MTLRHSDLQQLLLTLVAPGARPRQDLLNTAIDWDAMRIMVRQHRLGPLLHRRLSCEAADLNVPQSFADGLAASFRRHGLRSLDLRREMVRIQLTLRDNGIAAAFLKGAFLAFHVYPEPALRPLRDLDVLVPKDQAMRAFDALLKAGFTRSGRFPGNPAAALNRLKHLPPLTSSSGRVAVELHIRLAHPGAGMLTHTDLADDPDIWKRLTYRCIAGVRIGYLSATDQLLHLIVHAVFDHRLNNGPLVLTDMAALLARVDIDWPSFWRMAAERRWLRACWLLLHLVRHFDSSLPFVAPDFAAPPELPRNFIATAATLMLANLDLRADVGLAADILRADAASGKARVLLARLCPPRELLDACRTTAGLHGTGETHLAHWWRLATVRVPQYLAGRRNRSAAKESAASAELQRWLAE